MKVSRTKIIARYNETDQMGVIHHGVYINWFEVARTEWVKELGLSYRQIEENGLMIPVIGVTVIYHVPAKFEDTVIVETSLKDYDSIKMSFAYKVLRASDQKRLVEGSTTHCWTNSQMRPISLKKKNPQLHQLILNAADLK